jgi:type IV secretory pathway TrbF-like protein
MIFKRTSIRYSESPEPATPYQAAHQLWDDRVGSARVQAQNWRLMAFGCLALSLVIAAGLIWQSARSTITPYVVEVDTRGDVRAVGPAAERYRPTDAQIGYHLSRFVRNIRSLPIDPIVLRENWLEAYNYVTPRAAAILNEHARTHDPFAHVGRESIAIETTSVVRASSSSFQIRWIEHTYVNGTRTSTQRWTAILSIVLRPPSDEDTIRKNPLGIYVDGLDWSREIGSTAAQGDAP